MALSAFGVEDPRISKADKDDFKQHAAVIAGTGATGAAAAPLTAMAINAHRREKSHLREADVHMGQHWKDRVAGARIPADVHQGMAQGNLELARRARRLKRIHGGAAGVLGGAALTGAGALGVRAYNKRGS